MYLFICWFILICVSTNPSCHSPLHITETWTNVFKMVRRSLLACDSVTSSVTYHLLIFLFAPRKAWKENILLVSVVYFIPELYPYWEEEGRAASAKLRVVLPNVRTCPSKPVVEHS